MNSAVFNISALQIERVYESDADTIKSATLVGDFSQLDDLENEGLCRISSGPSFKGRFKCMGASESRIMRLQIILPEPEFDFWISVFLPLTSRTKSIWFDYDSPKLISEIFEDIDWELKSAQFRISDQAKC